MSITNNIYGKWYIYIKHKRNSGIILSKREHYEKQYEVLDFYKENMENVLLGQCLHLHGTMIQKD